MDQIYLAAPNLPDLLINLWHGTLDCDENDNHSTWDWAKLVGHIWQEHGRPVAAAPPYLPGSFDQPPHNLA